MKGVTHMSMVLLVQAIELAQAAMKMNEALENYRESTKAAKAAAEDIASKWEGAAKDAFVADQENAYNWYVSIADVVGGVIRLAQECLQRYQDAEERLKSIMKS